MVNLFGTVNEVFLVLGGYQAATRLMRSQPSLAHHQYLIISRRASLNAVYPALGIFQTLAGGLPLHWRIGEPAQQFPHKLMILSIR